MINNSIFIIEILIIVYISLYILFYNTMKSLIIIFTLILIGCSGSKDTNVYTQEEINYFTEIALGAEFGDTVPVIKKWKDNIRIKINGTPTAADIQTINSIVSDLNELIGEINVKIVDKNENITITFSPESDFAKIESKLRSDQLWILLVALAR